MQSHSLPCWCCTSETALLVSVVHVGARWVCNFITPWCGIPGSNCPMRTRISHLYPATLWHPPFDQGDWPLLTSSLHCMRQKAQHKTRAVWAKLSPLSNFSHSVEGRVGENGVWLKVGKLNDMWAVFWWGSQPDVGRYLKLGWDFRPMGGWGLKSD